MRLVGLYIQCQRRDVLFVRIDGHRSVRPGVHQTVYPCRILFFFQCRDQLAHTFFAFPLDAIIGGQFFEYDIGVNGKARAAHDHHGPAVLADDLHHPAVMAHKRVLFVEIGIVNIPERYPYVIEIPVAAKRGQVFITAQVEIKKAKLPVRHFFIQVGGNIGDPDRVYDVWILVIVGRYEGNFFHNQVLAFF